MTIIFTLIISFIGFFAVVTCVTLFYYKRGSRRSERLEQNQVSQGRESFAVGGRWLERPVVWEVWVDKHPKPAVQWDDLLVRLGFSASFLAHSSRNLVPASQLYVRSRSTLNPYTVASPDPDASGPA